MCVGNIQYWRIETFCFIRYWNILSSKSLKILNYIKSLCIIFMLNWFKYFDKKPNLLSKNISIPSGKICPKGQNISKPQTKFVSRGKVFHYLRQNMSQRAKCFNTSYKVGSSGAKCFNTPILYTTLTSLKYHNILDACISICNMQYLWKVQIYRCILLCILFRSCM